MGTLTAKTVAAVKDSPAIAPHTAIPLKVGKESLMIDVRQQLLNLLQNTPGKEPRREDFGFSLARIFGGYHRNPLSISILI